MEGAPAGCSRSYSVSSASGAVTRLALAVSFENSVRDGPLLYLLDDTQVSDVASSLNQEKILIEAIAIHYVI